MKMYIQISFSALILSVLTPLSYAQNTRHDACNANGIEQKRCDCIFAEVESVHGAKAADFVAYDMALMYDEADQARGQIGEDKAFAASDLFEVSSQTTCSNARMLRQSGNAGSGGQTGAVSAISAANEASSNQTQNSGPVQGLGIIKMGTTGPLLDLRGETNGTLEVQASLTQAALEVESSSKNMRNFVGFYPIVDLNGGIDTDGDGIANTVPGDADYASTAQMRALSKKLYVSQNGGIQQVLGDVFLEGGKLYAPYLRYETNATQAAGFNLFSGNSGSLEDMIRGMTSTPMHLHFAFPAANTNAAAPIRFNGPKSIHVYPTGETTSPDIKLTLNYFPD